MRRIGVKPQVVPNTLRSDVTAIDGSATPHKGCAQSIHARRGIVKVLGWIQQWGSTRQFKVRDTGKVVSEFGLHVIAYNLIRLGSLLKYELIVA